MDTLRDSISDIRGILISTRKRLKRITPALYEINYTISEFIQDNKISKNDFTIDFNEHPFWTK